MILLKCLNKLKIKNVKLTVFSTSTRVYLIKEPCNETINKHNMRRIKNIKEPFHLFTLHTVI